MLWKSYWSAFLIFIASQSCAQSGWTIRNPPPPDHKLSSIVWTGTQLVAVGGPGNIVTSTDGVHWTSRQSGVTAYLNGLAWTGKRLVSVGQSGTILTSENGVDWKGSALPGTPWLSSIRWTGKQLIACGGSGSVHTSADGDQWVSHPLGITAVISDIAWNDSVYVGIDEDGGIATSPNLDDWTPRKSGSEYRLSSIVWTGSRFIVLGINSVALQSPDGNAWTPMPEGMRGAMEISQAGELLIGLGQMGTIVTSTDGETWTNHSMDILERLESVVWTGSRFVAVGDDGDVLLSQDGKAWVLNDQGFRGDLTDILYAKDRFVAMGGGHAFTSTDGVEWKDGLIPGGSTFSSPVWNGAQLLAIGANGRFEISDDAGNVWKSTQSQISEWLTSLAWTGSLWVVVGQGGSVFTSLDGTEWTRRTSGTTQNLYALAWTGAKLYAGGDNGALIESTDGLTWSAINLATTNSFKTMVWTGTRLLAFTYRDTVWASESGGTWKKQPLGVRGYVNSAVWTGSMIVAVGGGGSQKGGIILASPNGNDWTMVSSGEFPALAAVAASPFGYAAVTGGGLIITAPKEAVVPSKIVLGSPASKGKFSLANGQLVWTGHRGFPGEETLSLLDTQGRKLGVARTTHPRFPLTMRIPDLSAGRYIVSYQSRQSALAFPIWLPR